MVIYISRGRSIIKIDGQSLSKQSKSLTGSQDAAWRLLFKLTSCKWHGEIVGNEEFVLGTVGPNCVELESSLDSKFAVLGEDYAYAIHDVDNGKTLLLTDDKFCCEHVANHELYEMAIALSPLEFYFMDDNYPEVLYYGTQEDFQRIEQNGGCPRRWYGPVAGVGGTVIVDSNIGQLELEVRHA